jgi:hypothetical protein
MITVVDVRGGHRITAGHRRFAELNSVRVRPLGWPEWRGSRAIAPPRTDTAGSTVRVDASTSSVAGTPTGTAS